MSLPAADRKALLPVLDDLIRAAEEIVSTGLGAASKTTLDRLDLAFKEASRLKLGRLAASLRYASDELGRYVARSPEFNARRLSLFLNRSWIVAQGLAKAIRAGDEATLGRLLWSPPAPEPLPSIDVVTLGVQKRVTRSVVAFDFRLRQIGGARPGRSLIWSFVANRKSTEVPVEAWLHLPQPQKFDPKIFLDGAALSLTQVAVAPDDRGGGRLLLGPKATVTAGERFSGFSGLLSFDRPAALARVRAHTPSPLDLEVELQEELGLEDWTLGEPEDRGRPDQRTWPLRWRDLALDVNVSTGEEGQALSEALDQLRKAKDRPPLFGVMHYELCRLVFAPLSVHERGAMRQLMLSTAAIDKKKLMAALF